MDKNLFYDLTYGMFVIGTKYKGRDVGCFVNTVCQITNESMIISVSLNKNNFTNLALKENRKFSVSILSTKTNPEVIGKFGFFSSKEVDKFQNFKKMHDQNLPIVDENLCGYMICEIVDVISVDTHDIFLAKVTDCKKTNNYESMTYAYYHKEIKGKAPKTAPTYIEDEKVESKSNCKKYKCIICGHIYDEEKEEVKFEDLPDDWTCPICGVGKKYFKVVT